MVTVEEILQEYPGGDVIGTYPIIDEAGSLRQYLHDAYLLGTSYALLIGDPNISISTHRFIPFRYGCCYNNPNPDSYYFTRPSTDWYFSDLQGDWKRDTDSNYGEPDDDTPSRFANISVGRLLCSSNQELSNWTNKTMQYEKNPGNGNAGYVIKSLITRADNIGSTEYANTLTHYNHIILEEVPSCSDPNPTFPKGSDIISTVNANNCGLMTWFNHGGTNHQHSCMVSMTSNTDPSNINNNVWKLYSDSNHVDNGPNVQPENNNSLDCLTNNGKPFIVYSTSCNVTPFDHTVSNSLNQTRNCGESFTVGGLYGGTAFMGNTADASGGYYYSFARVLDAAYDDESISHLGNLENHSKHIYQNNGGFAYHYKHNLIGDPECQIWTKVPQAMDVNVLYSPIIPYVQGSVTVSFNGLTSGEKVTVTLYSENDVFLEKQMVIGVNNTVEFDSVYPTTANPIVVTATCYNHLPYQEWIPVTQLCYTEVTTDQTWLTNTTSNCDIIIKPNATLTVKCEVGMNANCKVIVEPGGKLIIDGGKFYCSVIGHQWQGIKVLGTGGDGWQSLIQGHYQQGYVSMKNNAQIHNARVALDLWDGINVTTTGGIVQAKDALFKNNGIAVRIRPFNNINPVTHLVYDYSAQFYNCDFDVDNGYVGVIFNYHIDLRGVKGVKFNGCRYTLHNCPPAYCADEIAAIYSYNAGFNVDHYCPYTLNNPCLNNNNYIISVFDGFVMAINTIQDNGTASSFSVKNALFENNVYGIRSHGNTNPTVLFNDFIIGNNGTCGTGIYLKGTPSFCVEENNFAKPQNYVNGVDYFGIIAEDTQGQNEIYKNSFTNLTCANLAIGDNCIPYDIQRGLTYCCNENNNNLIDFYVKKGLVALRNQGVQLYQGSATLASGNTFSQGALWHIYNDGDYAITYYCNHSNSAEIPDDIKIYKVRKCYASVANDCPTHYSNGGEVPVLSIGDQLQKENDYNAAYAGYNSMKALYNSYVDGGSTEDELSDIASATPSMMWELRSQLLSHSPFLSQESLRAATDREDVLTESVQFEILAANPEELGRDSLMDHVEDKGYIPSYMINALKELGSGPTTYKSVLESQMSGLNKDYNRAANDIVRSILNDTVLHVEELRTWLSNLENINADRQIVSSYLMEGNYVQAFAIANALPVLYDLKDADLLEHAGYMKMLGLYLTLDQQNRTIFELTDAEAFMVDSVSTHGIGIAQTMATSISEVIEGVTNLNCPQLELGTKGNSVGNVSSEIILNQSIDFSVIVKPNPATTWISVDYVLPNKAENANLIITNMLGVKTKAVELNGNHGQRVLDCRDMANGVYLYTVSCGQLQQTGKLIIAK